ncbi:helix-turn-helix transcriptional regulator [Peptococcaceae bacterium 1198_IL3148]
MCIDVGKRIKRLRKQQKLSQRQLGELTGKSQETISRMENGKIGVSLVFLNKLSKIFKIPLDYFLKQK